MADCSKHSNIVCMCTCAHVYMCTLYTSSTPSRDTPTTPVSVKKNVPLYKKTHGNISLKNTKSGAGEQFPLLDGRIRVRVKGMFFHRYRYHHKALMSPVCDLMGRTSTLWRRAGIRSKNRPCLVRRLRARGSKPVVAIRRL